jgi:hypothetical protein
MDSREKTSDESAAASRSLRKVILLVAPIWIVLLVEIVGQWRFSKDTYSEQYAIHLGPLYRLTAVMIGVVIASPLLVIAGFSTLFSLRKETAISRKLFRIFLLVLTISALVTMFSCMWTCGGHPTWIEGYK